MELEIYDFKKSLESDNPLLVFSTFASILNQIVDFSTNCLTGKNVDNLQGNLKSISEIQKNIRTMCKDTFEYIKEANIEEITRNREKINENVDKIAELFIKLESTINIKTNK